MNRQWLNKDLTEQQVKERMGNLWNIILDSKILVFGLEKRELYVSQGGIIKLQNLFYEAIKSGRLNEWLNKYSQKLTQFHKKISITEIENSKGEILTQMPEFREEYSNLSISELNENYLSRLEEFSKSLCDARSDYVVKILSEQKKNSGILYGAKHMERIKEDLQKRNLSYLSFENESLNEIIKMREEISKILQIK